MTHTSPRILVALSCVYVLTAAPVHAEGASVGKGWLLGSSFAGITSDPSEVVSGKSSVKGAYSGSATFTTVLYSDPTYVRFAAKQRYTFTLRYRIIEPGSAGFSFGFFSDRVGSAGPFVPTGSITGAAGATGTATLTATLFDFPDYAAGFKINGTGAIAIDEIKITDASGQLVASENAEGPNIVPGPLNLQLTDAVMIPTAGFLRSAGAKDLDGDNYPEAVLTVTDPNNNSTTPMPIVVVQANGQMRIATSDFFPLGAPTVKHSPMTHFTDLNNDGRTDIVFADAGGDPFGAGRISVAINEGGGKYRDVSDLIPADQQNTRSYAIVVGDILGDGQPRILLPDEDNGANTALLRWNGSGFDELRNWIPQTIWKGFPFFLHQQSWMNLADFDNDGKQDLLVSGQSNAANIQLVFGEVGGFTRATTVQVLPDGPWGHYSPTAKPPAAQGAEVQPIVVADFNNDGLADIFAAERKVVEYAPGAFNDTTDPNYATLHAKGGTVYSDDSFQVLINQGSRRFVDVTAPNYVNFGDRTYFSLLPVDVNNDGFLDVVGLYEANVATPPSVFKAVFGTTFFLNDGTGRFRPVDGSEIVGATITPSDGRHWNAGSFVPTVIAPGRIEGIVAETVGGCGGPGFCGATTLNLYKVVGNGSLGTGPNFANSAALGVPGFNEFYYLNEHPDVAAAIARGEYKSGLEHYLVEGRAKRFAIHAPNARPRSF